MTGPTTSPSTVWIVSDLHLGDMPDTAARSRSDAFARFLVHVVEDRLGAEENRDHLVILGDFMNLPNTSLVEARSAVEAVATAHKRVFDALGRLVDIGFDLVVVPGNHDIELTVESVFNTLKKRIVASSRKRGSVRLVPWVYYLPGVVYAEHGNQYHDINWYPTVLLPTRHSDSERLQRTSAQWLGQMGSLRAVFRVGPRQPLADVAGLANSLRRHPGWAMPGEAYLEAVAIPYGVSIGIGAEAVRSLDAISRRSAVDVVRRLMRKAARHLWTLLRRRVDFRPSESRDQYLRDALPEIIAVTRRHSISVPFYVFGHTHVAARSAVDPTALYLNAGTWSGQLPSDRASNPELWLTFLRITKTSADLMRWDDALGEWRVVEV